MRGVQIDKPSNEASNQWNHNIGEFVRQLTSPKVGRVKHSQSLDIVSPPDTTHCNGIRDHSVDLSIDMKNKCTLLSKQMAAKPVHTNRRKLMGLKDITRKYASFEIDEGVEISVDSTSSSCGLKENKVVFSCDSSPETSDIDINGDKRLTESKSVSTKKDKESKKKRFKRMITRPLRRSHSAGCEEDIPVHALFLDSDRHDRNDTMERRANDLSLYNERLFGASGRPYHHEQGTVHKTCSVDAAMLESSEFNNNSQAKTKSKNLPFKNMKKKFQFLRRRNTDTALVPKFSLPLHYTIPSYEQAFQWSRSFDSLLNDKCGLDLFKGFLKSEFSEENLEFWIACEEFRLSNDSNLEFLAQKIYGDFVAFQAPKEVNLDSNTRMTTVSRLENPGKETFEMAQHKIQALMEKDSYPRFLESELYQQLLESVSKV